MSKKIDIIKIGGSVITNKSKYATLKDEVLKQICTEIGKWGKKCIIVHGAGSFGHIIAEKHDIISGYKNESQLKGLLQIREDMLKLNQSVIENLRIQGLQALSFQTSALAYLDSEKKDQKIFLQPIKKAFSLGLTPVLYGDICFEKNNSFTILSGDTLINLISQKLPINRVIFVTDVDGLWGEKPESNETFLIEKATISELQDLKFVEIKNNLTIDVTGNMKGKISSIIHMLNNVEKVQIVNGLVKNRLLRLLNNEETKCTTLTKE
ncbi:MAG: isopentenyl phosphate kinase family protein [Candidatus Heimdallarchaeota archaeon]|nr:isopentenyl phosphate kinase family protein [Candidatus Heimdallarchaeota archaeon]